MEVNCFVNSDAVYLNKHIRKYTGKAELDKALHTLEGILKGIAIDETINQKEIDELKMWHYKYQDLIEEHPFNELIPTIAAILEDNIIDDEEYKNLLWLCDNLKTGSIYYNVITSDIQRLQGILHGILSDNVITESEIKGLQNWLDENDHLASVYPYDEINSLVTAVLADGKLTEDEKNLLKLYFSEFIDLKSSFNINTDEISKLKQNININGICAMCPEITIPNKAFCFTGISSKATRSAIKDTIESLGGVFNKSVTKQTDYLVVGNNGNPCWAFACYGRKVEKAINLRKAGHKILIVHENDFWDALEDMK